MSELFIHPTAIVSSKAKIGNNVSIGAFTIIEDDVVIGDNNEIRNSVTIANGTRIGNDNRIHAGAVIGTEPQDLKFDAKQPTLCIIGNRNTIREFVTMNRGTHASGETRIGDDSLLMSYVHVAHDCHFGSHNVIANSTQFGGHVTTEDWVNIGGCAKVHQFCRVGCHSMIGADVKIVMDLPPYTIIGREPPKIQGINIIGLRRRGFSKETIEEIKAFYNTILYSGLNNSDGIAKVRSGNVLSPEVLHCIEFIEASERGIHR